MSLAGVPRRRRYVCTSGAGLRGRSSPAAAAGLGELVPGRAGGGVGSAGNGWRGDRADEDPLLPAAGLGLCEHGPTAVGAKKYTSAVSQTGLAFDGTELLVSCWATDRSSRLSEAGSVLGQLQVTRVTGLGGISSARSSGALGVRHHRDEPVAQQPDRLGQVPPVDSIGSVAPRGGCTARLHRRPQLREPSAVGRRRLQAVPRVEPVDRRRASGAVDSR